MCAELCHKRIHGTAVGVQVDELFIAFIAFQYSPGVILPEAPIGLQRGGWGCKDAADPECIFHIGALEIFVIALIGCVDDRRFAVVLFHGIQQDPQVILHFFGGGQIMRTIKLQINDRRHGICFTGHGSDKVFCLRVAAAVKAEEVICAGI